jgi:hypothetical protein
MSKAYVDTTILTNVLLKTGVLRNAGLVALKRYDSTEMPTYAIKEFKAGPLSYWVWLHNKLKLRGSLADAVEAVRKLHPLQAHRKATCMEALEVALKEQKGAAVGEWVKKYGKNGQPDAIIADRLRYSLRRRILKAWLDRRKLVSTVVLPLNCYQESPPQEGRDGLLTLEPVACGSPGDCEVARQMKERSSDLVRLRDVLITLATKTENRQRLSTIKDFIRVPKRPVTERMCRSLGDAVFAFFAPPGSVILTTNTADHRPLANALGKSVETP